MADIFPSPQLPGFINLASGTISAAAALIVPLPTGFDRHRLILSQWIPATDATDLNLTISTNGGSSFETIFYSWGYQKWDANSTTPAITNAGGGTIGNAAAIKIMAGIASSSVRRNSAEIEMRHAQNNGVYKLVSTDGLGYVGTAPTIFKGLGESQHSAPITHLRLAQSSGNVSGNWTLLGA